MHGGLLGLGEWEVRYRKLREELEGVEGVPQVQDLGAPTPCSTLKMDLRCAQVAAGFIRPRPKRVFGKIDEADSEPAEPSVLDTNNF